MNKRKKVLVTGGAGYIGSHTVVKLYQSGYMPLIIDNLSNSTKKNLIGVNKILNTEIPFYKLDCTNDNEMHDFFNKHSDIYACIHFAALKSISESFQKPEKYFKNNILSTEVLLSCLERNFHKNLIFSSSCTVYGQPKNVPVNEDSPLNYPQSPYAETKQKCELLVKNSTCNSISLRYFNPIGTHDSFLIGDCSTTEVYNLVSVIAEVAVGIKENLIINGDDYSTDDGTCIRDYLHVIDLANAHVKALDYLFLNAGSHVFNVGTGVGLSVFDIINNFEKVNNKKIKYLIGPRRKGDIDKYYCNVDRIKNKLDWVPNRTIDDALKSAYIYKKMNIC